MYRNANVGELLEDALGCGQLELADGGTGRLRLLEIISYKIVSICKTDTSLEFLAQVHISLLAFILYI